MKDDLVKAILAMIFQIGVGYFCWIHSVVYLIFFVLAFLIGVAPLFKP